MPHDCEPGSSHSLFLPSDFAAVQFGTMRRNRYRQLIKRRCFDLEVSLSRHVRRSPAVLTQWMDVEKQEYRFLLTGARDGCVSIFDLTTPPSHCDDSNNCQANGNARQNCIELKRSKRPRDTGRFVGESCPRHDYGVTCCYWFPLDSGMFLSSGGDGLLRVWDTNRFTSVDEYSFPEGINQHSMAPAPQGGSGGTLGTLIAVAAESSVVSLVDLRTGDKTQTLSGHCANVRCIQWSPMDSRILISASEDGKILFWDIRQCKSHMAQLGSNAVDAKNDDRPRNCAHSGAIVALCFTADGQQLVSFGTEGHLRVWDTILCRELLSDDSSFELAASCPLRQNVRLDIASEVGLAFVPCQDDVKVVSLDISGQGQCLRTLKGHFRTVNSCVYREPYQELLTSGNDKSIHVWCPDTDKYFLSPTSFNGEERVVNNDVQINSTLFADNWD